MEIVTLSLGVNKDHGIFEVDKVLEMKLISWIKNGEEKLVLGSGGPMSEFSFWQL